MLCDNEDSPDSLNELCEYRNEGRHDRAVWGRHVIDGYLNGYFNLVFHIQLRRINSEVCQFCAVLNRLKAALDFWPSAEKWSFECELPAAHPHPGHMAKAMLIGMVAL